MDDVFVGKMIQALEAMGEKVDLLRADIGVIRKKSDGNALDLVGLSGRVDSIDSSLRDLQSLVNANTPTEELATLQEKVKTLQREAGETRQARWSLGDMIFAAAMALIGGIALWLITK